ncbi:MAG: YybH family protein [Sporichthyaceae bacterium]
MKQSRRIRLLALPTVGVLLFGAGQLTGRSAAAGPVAPHAAKSSAVSATAAGAAGASKGVTDPTLLAPTFIEAWNAQRFDEIATYLTDDIVHVLPNQEPVKGKAAVMDLYRNLRSILGELSPDLDTHRVVRSKDTFSRAVSFKTTSGLRFTDVEVYVREADGNWRFAMIETGLRDPLP